MWCDFVAEREVLQRELAAAPDDEARSALLLFELGRVALAQGNQVEAAQYLLRAFSQRPQFRPTLRLARHVYRGRGDPRLIVKLFEAEARATRDHLSRAHLYRQQARVLWADLGDVEAARAKLDESILLDPSELASSKLLELICAAEHAYGARALLVEQQLEMVTDENVHGGLVADLALLRFRDEPGEAVRLLQDACRSHSSSVSLLVILEQLLSESGDDEQLTVVLERQADRERADLLWKGSLLARAARLAAHRGHLDRAVELFLRSSEVDPYPDTLADCFDLLIVHRRVEQAVEVGEQLFDLLDTPRLRAALACELGDYCRLQLDNESAASDWYHRCLLHAPNYQPALEGLSALLGRAGDVDGQLNIHVRDLASTQDPAARAHRLFRIAALLEQHGRQDEALEMHREALAARPAFLPSMLSLEQLLRRAGRWTELIRMYEDQLQHEQDDERVIHLLETMAGVWTHQLEQPDRAIDCYQRVIERAPSQLRAVNMAARLCAQAGRWQELVGLHEREIDLTTDGQRKVELLQRAGEVWEYRLLDLSHAIGCYQRALDFNPEFLPALRALGRLYRQKGRWKDLIAMHQAEVNVCADPEHAISLLCTIAEVYEEELLDEEAAAQAYRDVLARRPGYLHAIDSLARIWERKGHWPELVELLESTVDLLQDRSTQAALLCRIGILRAERLVDTEGAIHDLSQALRLAPDMVPPRVMLDQLLVATEADQQLAEHLTGRLERATEGHEQATLARELAELMERTRQDPAKAAALYERSLDAEPDQWTAWALARLYRQLDQPDRQCAMLDQVLTAISDDRTAGELELHVGQIKQESGVGDPLPHYSRALQLGVGRIHAYRAMERHVRDTGQRSRLPEVLAARIDLTGDPLELACLCTELAQTHQGLGDASAAEKAFRAALEHDPKHLSALWGLGRLLEHQERWAEAVEVVQSETLATASSSGTVAGLLRAAEIARDKLRDEEKALPIYKRVLRLQPGHRHAYDCLHEIMTRREDWAELASLIRAQISATNDEQQQARMFGELGYIYLDRLAQQRKGEACLRRVVSLEPGNLAALTTLGDIYYGREEWSKAQAVYVRAAEVAVQPEARSGTLRRLGQVYRQLDRAADALAAFNDAASCADNWPEPWLLRQIAEAAQVAGNHLERANALDQLADISEEAQERIQARKQAAFLAEECLDDEQRAIRSLQQVLVLDPLDLEAIERLAALHGRASNRSALFQHIQAAVAHHRVAIGNEPLDARLYEQLARIFRWQRHYDRFYCLCLVLRHMGHLGNTEDQFVDEHRRLCTSEPRLPLEPVLYEQVLYPAGGLGPLRDFFRCIAPALIKATAEDPSHLGLGRSARANKHPQKSELKRLSGVVGRELEFDLWLSPREQPSVDVRSFGRPALVIDQALVEGALALAPRFHLGRAFVMVREPIFLLREFSGEQIAALLWAIARRIRPTIEVPAGVEGAPVDDLAGRVWKAASRKLKRQLAELLTDELLGADQGAIDQLLRSAAQAADRCGLLLAGDPSIAFNECARVPLVGAQPTDLYQFVASEDYYQLREELGLAPASTPQH